MKLISEIKIRLSSFYDHILKLQQHKKSNNFFYVGIIRKK